MAAAKSDRRTREFMVKLRRAVEPTGPNLRKNPFFLFFLFFLFASSSFFLRSAAFAAPFPRAACCVPDCAQNRRCCRLLVPLPLGSRASVRASGSSVWRSRSGCQAPPRKQKEKEEGWGVCARVCVHGCRDGSGGGGSCSPKQQHCL